MNPWHDLIARRAQFRCEYCRAPEVAANLAFEVEHILPQSRGGTDDADNFALACRSCNLHKGASVAAPDPTTGQSCPLFDPRTDLWTDHFTIDLVSGDLIGLTATGRATVGCLRMNGDYQKAARIVWIRFDLI